jgi:hypothetical protein
VTGATEAESGRSGENQVVKESFYVRVDDETYEPTELTRGPWDAYAQHAGPPAALLGHVIEGYARDGMRIARITFDILRPVPLSTLRAETRMVHGGRRVEVVEATLTSDGKTVMRANALRIRAEKDAAPDGHLPGRQTAASDKEIPDKGIPDPEIPDPEIAAPDELEETRIPIRFDVGYHTAMDTRNAKGAFEIPGPATVWFRMRHPLIDGEPVRPVERVLIAADSGNGVSGVLNMMEYVYINPELTVHLYRYPTTEWVCLEAVSHISPDGIGLADTVLHDEAGPIGRGSQSLYVARQAGSRPT